MTPFYPGPSALILQSDGEPIGQATTLNFTNGSLTLSGSTAEFAAPQVTLTDGSQTVASLATLTVNSLDMTIDAVPPEIVQSAFAYSGQTLQLTNPITIGNVIVILVTCQTAVSPPSGFTTVESINFNVGYSSIFIGTATATTLPGITMTEYGTGAIYETTPNTGYTGTGSTQQSSSSPYAFNNSAITTTSLLLMMFPASGNASDANAATPTNTVIDKAFANGLGPETNSKSAVYAHNPAQTDVTLTNCGFSSSGANVVTYMSIALKGQASGGNASITG
jgi:hypothetical protein